MLSNQQALQEIPEAVIEEERDFSELYHDQFMEALVFEQMKLSAEKGLFSL